MSWKFAGMIFTKSNEKKVLSSFSNLRKTTKSIAFNEAMKTDFKDFAIGEINDAVMVFNHILPYDSAYGLKNLSQLDQTLASLSIDSKALCFFMDGVSGAYGMSLFRNGQKVRSIKRISGSPPKNYGPKTQEETDVNPEDVEELIFELISSFLQKNIDNLIFYKSDPLSIFKDK